MADCKHERAVNVSAKCSDMCCVRVKETGQEKDGYVPDDMGIGGSDYIEFDYCLDCGHMFGEWPLPKTALEGT